MTPVDDTSKGQADPLPEQGQAHAIAWRFEDETAFSGQLALVVSVHEVPVDRSDVFLAQFGDRLASSAQGPEVSGTTVHGPLPLALRNGSGRPCSSRINSRTIIAAGRYTVGRC